MPKQVIIQHSAKAQKGKDNLNADERSILEALEQEMRQRSGKPGAGWKNLGPAKQVDPEALHCHLTRSKVVVWIPSKKKIKGQEVIVIRFKYVGSRENAPY